MIWTPLLAHLQALHPTLQSVLVSRIIAGLFDNPGPAIANVELETISLDHDERRREASYNMCAAAWAYWLITGSGTCPLEFEDRAEEAVVSLIMGLGPTVNTEQIDTKA